MRGVIKGLTSLLFILALVGCSEVNDEVNDQVNIEDRNKEFSCIDENNSTFTYNTNNMTDIETGFNTYSMTIQTHEGLAVYINQDNEGTYRCTEIEGK